MAELVYCGPDVARSPWNNFDVGYDKKVQIPKENGWCLADTELTSPQSEPSLKARYVSKKTVDISQVWAKHSLSRGDFSRARDLWFTFGRRKLTVL